MSSIIKVDTIQDQDGNNIINENANTITIGKSGDTVQVASGATLEGAGIQWQSSIKTASFTAVANEGYWINTTSTAITMTLPASASVGDTIEFSDYARTWGTNNVTINQNSLNFQGDSSNNPVYDVSGQSVRIVYSGATQGWIPTSDDDVKSFGPYSVEYLVVAGGGSGGTGAGAGAGAGGLLTGTLTFNPGTVYTATIGGGGSGVPGAPKTQGNDGSDSSLAGSDITNVTCTGGGGGGGQPSNSGRDGGSGGGEFSGNGVGAGTVGQGNNGESRPSGSGGGGGAGEVGGTDGAGFGGDGSPSSITGSATFYAGGGGGAAAGAGSGGDGGGTDGVPNPSSSSPSPANTGGGSGGADDQPSGNGGSGVVILRIPTSNYSETTTGSPTITTDGGFTIVTFTATGTYTG